MSLPPSRNPMQELARLGQQGSSDHNPTNTVDETRPVVGGFLATVLNPGQWFRRKRREGIVVSEIHNTQLANLQDRDTFRDDQQTKAIKHSDEVDRIIDDDAKDKRAKRHLRATGHYDGIATADAMHQLTNYFDETIEFAKATTKDKALRKKLISEIRFMHRRQITDLRTMHSGLKYNPDGGPTGEIL